MNDTDAPGAQDDEAKLTALLGSRLCHDLASPLGALNNGVELMELDGQGPSEEIALLRATLDTTMARLRFFRLAFGAGADGSPVGAREASQIVEAMYRGSRRQVTWEDEADRPRSEIRLAFLALNCIESATPWSSTTEVRRDAARWIVAATAERFKPIAHWDDLAAGTIPADLASAEVQFGLLAREAARQGRGVEVALSETSIRLAI